MAKQLIPINATFQVVGDGLKTVAVFGFVAQKAKMVSMREEYVRAVGMFYYVNNTNLRR